MPVGITNSVNLLDSDDRCTKKSCRLIESSGIGYLPLFILNWAFSDTNVYGRYKNDTHA